MLDLRVLRDLWTEAGAREVFAQLVTQCVCHAYGSAGQIRPDPGDEGVDTFVGEFGNDLKIWQVKYFCDGVGAAQQKQIRKSWKTCINSQSFKRVVAWTLCLPEDLSVDETTWWQRWSKKQAKLHGCSIELWTKSQFIGFRANPILQGVFDYALRRTDVKQDHKSLIADLKAMLTAPSIKTLPAPTQYKDAVFVKKLEAAGVKQHRAARTAFYNFELLRTGLTEGGNAKELNELQSLQERVLDLWEGEFNSRDEASLGKSFYSSVEQLIEKEAEGQLKTSLAATPIHKKGAVHYWADLCEAGWTSNHKDVGESE